MGYSKWISYEYGNKREREREMRGNWWNGRVWIVSHSIGRDVLDSRSLALGSNSPFQCDPWSGFGLGLGPCVIRDSIRQKRITR